jgi:hypothetical protein
LGKVTLFDGDPDEGKSLVTIDLAARLSRGSTMPDGTETGCPEAGAVIVSLEDGAGDTIRPRLEAAGAVLERVRIVNTIKGADGAERTPTIPDDLPAIEAAIQSVNAKLLILDPLVGTLNSKTNSYRDQDIRRALAPVAALAERLGIAVVCIRHLTKGDGQNPKYRGGGSIGIIGAARAAFLFADAPDREGFHVMAPIKGNLWHGRPPAFEYSIGTKIIPIIDKDGSTVQSSQPAITWHGESDISAQALLAQPEDTDSRSERMEAMDWLREILSDGPVPAKKIETAAKSAGHALKTVRRAKDALGIKPDKHGFQGVWSWQLPKDGHQTPKMATPERWTPLAQVATFGPPEAGGDGGEEGEL